MPVAPLVIVLRQLCSITRELNILLSLLYRNNPLRVLRDRLGDTLRNRSRHPITWFRMILL